MVRLVRSRAAVPVPVLALALSMSLTGCAPLVGLDKPSPDGPHISNLRLTPDESSVGCPVELSFSVDTAQDALVKAIAAWTWARGREGTHGYLTLAADQQALGSQPGDRFVAPLWPGRSGMYRYYVQVEDRVGRKSNVLKGALPVSGWWSSGCQRGSNPDPGKTAK